MRAYEIITEIRVEPVPGIQSGYPGRSKEDREKRGEDFIGKYDNYYNVWNAYPDRPEGSPHALGAKARDYELEVMDDTDTIVLELQLRAQELDDTMQDGSIKQTLPGHQVSYVAKTPEGTGSDINMIDFYKWVMNTLQTALISDKTQSKGGESIWRRLASDPDIDVFAHNIDSVKQGDDYSNWSQVDEFGDADSFDTWEESDQEIVRQANSARKSAGYWYFDDAERDIQQSARDGKISSEEAKAQIYKLAVIEDEIRKEAKEARKEVRNQANTVLFAVPSNRSMHN